MRRKDVRNMQVQLKDNEKIEDLQCGGLRIIQSAKEYRFTTDAVLLANFFNDMQGKLCVEFGAGSGVISILVARKKRPARIVAIELQPNLADMARRSVELNGMSGQIEVVCGDLKDAAKYVDKPADVVVCNPPYRRINSGERQLAENIALCRHELAATLEDVISSAGKALNNRGTFYLVHQAERIAEIVTLCSKYNRLSPSRQRAEFGSCSRRQMRRSGLQAQTAAIRLRRKGRIHSAGKYLVRLEKRITAAIEQ